jgi:hypothetical protein
MTKKTRGRPPLEKTKNAIIKLRCTMSDKSKFVRHSKKQGFKLSAWILEAAQEKINREK